MAGGQGNHYLEHYFTSYFHSSPGLTASLQNPPLWGTAPSPCKGSIHTGDSGHEAKTLISSLPFWHSLWFWGRNTSGLPLWEELNTPLPSVICGIYGGSTEQQTLGTWKNRIQKWFHRSTALWHLGEMLTLPSTGMGVSDEVDQRQRDVHIYTSAYKYTHSGHSPKIVCPSTLSSLKVLHIRPLPGTVWSSSQVPSSERLSPQKDQTNAHNSG